MRVLVTRSRAVAFAAALSAIAVPAAAQSDLYTPQEMHWHCMAGGCFLSTPPSGHAATGNPDLDRAMVICDAHLPISNVYNLKPIWPNGYEACGKVLDAWERSDTARQQREAAQKEAADKAWLDQYAGTLP